MTDVGVELIDGFVALVELRRPPNNFFDVGLISALADAYDELDADDRCRAIVLCAAGKHFCAGADFSGASRGAGDTTGDLYTEAVRLFEAKTPVVAAVQGAAIGGGLGLACSADFRLATPTTRLAANFAQLGFHHGFGLSVTLPAIVGQQHCATLLYTGRRINGEEAAMIGLVDSVVDEDQLRPAAIAMAAEIASSAPLAVRSIRTTLRADIAERVRAATNRERQEQDRLRGTDDWAEGVRASAERRPPRFTGR
jgi:enoyl-CoA hydratase/carnithine racemase